MKDKKEIFLKVFKTTNAVFEFMETMQLTYNGNILPNKMHQLHKMALKEVEKENPDFTLIDSLIAEMENMGKENIKL